MQQKLRAAKSEELVLREKNDGLQWQRNFAETKLANTQANGKEEIAEHIMKHFKTMTGGEASTCLLSKNFGRWAQTDQRFWFEKCNEDGSTAYN